jgi:hypothetical protein
MKNGGTLTVGTAIDGSAKNKPEIPPPPLADLLSAVLASDLAIEVDAEFTGRIKMGWDVPAATGHVLGKFRSALSSTQDGPVVLIALAALQLREGHLQAVIREAALDLIDSGEAINAYRSADFGQRKLAAAMLEQFSTVLRESTPRAEE